MGELLERYDTLSSSLAMIHQYLSVARQRLNGLPASEGRAGLLGLTEYLARQTNSLEVCH